MSGMLLAAVLVLSACGVATQDQPEPVVIEYAPTAGQDATPSGEGPRVTVYFVRGARLEPVPRSVDSADLVAALEILATGPTRQEVVNGLRTAVAPQTFEVTRTSPADATVSIDVPPEFTSVAGGNQLLAVAQLVWTVTQFSSVRRVRVTADGRPLEVPTDDGLEDGAVEREDYLSVAPADGPPQPEDPPATPSPTTAPTETGTPGETSGSAPAPSPTATGRRRARGDRRAAVPVTGHRVAGAPG